VNASNNKRKYLVPFVKVGNIRTASKLYSSNGLFNKQIEFAVGEIKENLEEE